MDRNEKQTQLLNAVRAFGKTRRYHGMMPRRVVASLCDAEVRQAFAQGLVAYAQMQVGLHGDLQGIILTGKGLKVLSGK